MAPARAGLVVSIQNTSVALGGTETVDVFLTSTAASGSPDLINNYAFQLQITNNGTDGTQLAFANSQNFSYISNTSLNPAYLFLGDSFDAAPPASPVGSPGQTVYSNDTFTGADDDRRGYRSRAGLNRLWADGHADRGGRSRSKAGSSSGVTGRIRPMESADLNLGITGCVRDGKPSVRNEYWSRPSSVRGPIHWSRHAPASARSRRTTDANNQVTLKPRGTLNVTRSPRTDR